jgi:flagellar hook assembly protein FlgD
MASVSGTSARDWLAGQTSSTSGTTNTTYDAVFTDEKDQGVSAQDFLTLMVTQLKNQDFMNPVDDTQYVAQLAQFATMQQMQELAEYSKSSYVASLLGKTVTASKFKVNGELDTTTGAIDKISLVDGEYTVSIGDKSYSLEQIMQLHDAQATQDPAETGGEVDYAQTGFLLSLIGKNVTAAREDEAGDTEEFSGMVEKVSMNDGPQFYIAGEWFTIDQLVSVSSPQAQDESLA